MSDDVRRVGGPFYDDIAIGDVFDGAPAVTLTDGLAAAHHAIVGGRLRLPFDDALSAGVTGRDERFASPAMVWDFAIGQTTLVTQRAIANLFYRGLRFLRFPGIGDTLKTRTTIVGLRRLAAKPKRPTRGLVVMHMTTTDQAGRPILDFYRCAMIAARKDGNEASGELDPPHGSVAPDELSAATAGWNLAYYRDATMGPHFPGMVDGVTYRVDAGDVVSSAAELARLTFNLAAVHHDSAVGADGRRLVYGGHTIGIAAAQITRAFPGLVTILAWQSCEHTGPVYEGDTLHSDIQVEKCAPLVSGGLVHLRSLVRARRTDGTTADVLDWRSIGLFA
jgi:acyl dehydratase